MNFSSENHLKICLYFYTAWNVVYILLLPVFMSVIYIVFQQWRKPQTQSRSSTTNHSDIFTSNLAALDVFGVLGACFLTGSFFTSKPDLALSGNNLTFLVQYGQMLFHNLICLERYLAVVHPITYLHLKKKGNVMRNICIVAVWLINTCIFFGYHFNDAQINLLSVLIIGVISLVSITFFCVSVLCVLIRPGPGERGGDRRRIDQTKRRAFYTMMTITAVFLLKFVTMLAAYIVYLSTTLKDFKVCIFMASAQWLNTPSSLVPLVIFLQRQIVLRQKRRTKQ